MKEQRKNPQQPTPAQPKWQPQPQQPLREKDPKREHPQQPQKKWQGGS